MAENKVRIEDELGNIYYPHTKADSVFMSDGSTVEEKVTTHLDKYSTKQDVTYYVNNASGNDINDGLTNNAAFKTIGKVLSLIPRIINHVFKIEIAPGTYNEDLIIHGRTGSGQLLINGATTLTNTHNVKSISIQQCLLNISIKGVNTTDTTKNSFTIARSNSAYIDKCRAHGGFLFADAKSSIRNSEGYNSQNGGLSLIENSIVMSENNIGVNNVTSASVNASMLYVIGSLPNNNQGPTTANGGIVTRDIAKKQQEQWITAVLQNGWTPFDAAVIPSYYKDEFEVVRLQGRIKGGSVGTMPALTLPVGYRVSHHAMFALANGVQAYITSNGGVCVYSGSIADVWLDGITYRAEG